MTKAPFSLREPHLVDAEYPEEWEVVHQNPWYEVSTWGRVRSWVNNVSRLRRRPKILTISQDMVGYRTVGIKTLGKRKTTLVHRLVAEAFLGIQEGMEVNHKNGEKKDNRLENLEWCTPSQNRKHAYDQGLQVAPKGQNNSYATITDAQALEIKQRLVDGQSLKGISIAMGIPDYTAQNIKRHLAWKHIPWPEKSYAS